MKIISVGNNTYTEFLLRFYAVEQTLQTDPVNRSYAGIVDGVRTDDPEAAPQAATRTLCSNRSLRLALHSVGTSLVFRFS